MAGTVEAWRAFAAAAHALRGAVGIEGDKCEEPGCRTCQPQQFQFVPKGVTMPPPPPKDEPTPEERRNAQAFAKKATCAAGLGLGSLLLKRGRRGEACEALATALKADEACGEAWTLRAAAFSEMGGDGSILEIVELHLRKAAQLSPDDDEAQAGPPSRRVGRRSNDGGRPASRGGERSRRGRAGRRRSSRTAPR